MAKATEKESKTEEARKAIDPSVNHPNKAIELMLDDLDELKAKMEEMAEKVNSIYGSLNQVKPKKN